ncbi:MAG: ANTAR domain-containing protein [Lachnospiraceae bacterium]|nr:ANTAR domain-containing protein [Lachnospiraceae bacterium]
MVSIIVAFKKQTDAVNIRNLLTRFGYNVVGVCTSGASVLNVIDQMIDSDGIVISGCRLTDMDYFQLYKYLPDYYEMVIMGSQAALGQLEYIDALKVALPMKTQEFVNNIQLLETTMMRKRKRRREQPKNRSGEDRILIENAKSLLMEAKKYTEEDAHRYLQRTSMSNGTSMVETAQMVMELFA